MYRYTNISFPSLGIDIDPVRAFSIGPLTIHMYGLIIAFGLCLAVAYAMRRSKEFGLTEDHILDGVLWVTPFAILCARAYYCAFSWELYADDPISVLYIWNGGIAIYGGVLGAVAGIIASPKMPLKPFWFTERRSPAIQNLWVSTSSDMGVATKMLSLCLPFR